MAQPLPPKTEEELTLKELMAQQVESTNRLTGATLSVERILTGQENRRKWEHRTMLAVGVLIIVGIMVVAVLIVQGQDKSNQGRQILRDNAANTQVIKECTTPGYECYKRQQAQLIALINFQYVVELCSRREVEEAAYKKCVQSNSPLAKELP